MSTLLGLAIPAIIAALILLVAGAPTDFEALTGASGLAVVACYAVGIVFARRYIITRSVLDDSERDRLYAWMLVTMVAVAVCTGWLQIYRFGFSFANASGAESAIRWFTENRVVSTIITLILATAMIAKLRYPLSQTVGRWWIAIVGTAGVALFFALAYLPRAL